MSDLFKRNPVGFNKGLGGGVGCTVWVITGQEDELNLSVEEASL